MHIFEVFYPDLFKDLVCSLSTMILIRILNMDLDLDPCGSGFESETCFRSHGENLVVASTVCLLLMWGLKSGKRLIDWLQKLHFRSTSWDSEWQFTPPLSGCLQCRRSQGSIPDWDTTVSYALCRGCRWLWSTTYYYLIGKMWRCWSNVWLINAVLLQFEGYDTIWRDRLLTFVTWVVER